MAIRARQYSLAYHRGEPWHYVGDVGEPAFQNSWHNVTGTSKMAFRRREEGVVDLQGVVAAGSDSAVFTLPLGYRPSNFAIFPGLGVFGGNVLNPIAVSAYTSGSVEVTPVDPLPVAAYISGQFFLDAPAISGSGSVPDPGPPTFPSFGYRAVSTTGNITTTDVSVGASGTITLTLPAVATVQDGHTVTIKNEGTGTVTIDGYSTQTIDGDLTFALTADESVTLVSTGSNWIIV